MDGAIALTMYSKHSCSKNWA